MLTRVAITGGDVSGKTAVTDFLEREFGRTITIVPEVATALMNSLLPKLGTEILVTPPILEGYQEMFRGAQMSAETYWMIAGTARGSKMLCFDRGVPDLTAYTPGGWDDVCQRYGKTKEELYGRYDYAIVLTSVAVFDPELFEKLKRSNASRTERTASEAQELDRKIHEAWAGHPNVIEIDCTKGLDYLLAQVAKAIRKILAKEIEKKFRLPALPSADLFKDKTAIDIQQGYQIIEQGYEKRLRQMTYETGLVDHILTYKKGRGLERDEDEHTIADWAFAEEWLTIIGHSIEKTRLVVVENGNVFEIDDYREPDRQAIVEVNFNAKQYADEFTSRPDLWPAWMAGAIDVTEHDGFKAKNVALTGKFPVI